MTNYPFSVAIGATLSINSQSTFVYYESASAGGSDTSVKIKTDTGSEFILKVGQGARMDKSFKSLYLSNNLGQGTIIGNLVLSEGDFVDHRVVGTVDVVDGGKSRTLSGVAFLAYSNMAAAGSNIAHNQLWNPVGSTKNLIVESILVSTQTAQAFRLSRYNVALPSVSGTPQSKCVDGLAASAGVLLGHGTSLVQLGTILQTIYLQANVPLKVEYKEPIVVPPGTGFMTVVSASGTDLPTNFEYYEEKV